MAKVDADEVAQSVFPQPVICIVTIQHYPWDI